MALFKRVFNLNVKRGFSRLPRVAPAPVASGNRRAAPIEFAGRRPH